MTISPPYTPENVKGQVDSKAYLHIRKVVSTFSFISYWIGHLRLLQGPSDRVSISMMAGFS